MKSIRNSKSLYWGLILAFFILYMLVGFVSTLHSITFFELANTMWLAILLGVTYEVGQAAVLFSILMSDNSKNYLPWFLMILLTALQVTANVYASFKYMDGSGSTDWTYWQRSILFWLEADGPEMFKVIISWISGALLPVVALGMTALVADNLKLKDERDQQEENKKVEPLIDSEILDSNIAETQQNDEITTSNDKSSISKEDILKEIIDSYKEIATIDSPLNIEEFYNKTPFAEELLKNRVYNSLSKENVKLNSDGIEELEPSTVIDLPPKFLSKPVKPEDLTNEKTDNIFKNSSNIYDNSQEALDINRKETNEVIKENNTNIVETEIEEKVNEEKENLTATVNKTNEILHKENVEENIPEVDIKTTHKKVDTELFKTDSSAGILKKIPLVRKRGWHLKKEHIDSNGDVYKLGEYSHNKNDITEKKDNPPKKEVG